MGSDELKSALQNANEVELTVTGRKSGRESSRPIWFVEEGDKVLLLPLGGSDNNWYKNLRKTPAIGLAADSAEFHGEAKPTEDPSAVDHVVEAFGAK
jgi:F420H(2)-dependent quinone reductase